MIEFMKYGSLTNHYRQKEIGYWLDNYPSLKDEVFEVTEKIHGANFQVLITKDDIKYGKRSSFLSEGESFFDYQNVMKKYEEDFEKFRQYIIKYSIDSIRLFGELFGGKIQKGVDYGQEKHFKLFNIYLDDILQSPQHVGDIFTIANVSEDLHVPKLKHVVGIFEALEYDTKFNSLISNKEDNICEGVVVKPYRSIYENNGSIFYIKKKNEEFKEKSKEQKSSTPINDNLLKLQIEFSAYINENRLDSVVSKEGDIESEKQIGLYIKLLMEDAKEDFIKDFGDQLQHLDKKDLKYLYGKGNKLSVDLLKARL